MMNFINSIPDPIGWTFVGILGTVCCIAWYQLIKIFVQMWKDHHEEEEEEE